MADKEKRLAEQAERIRGLRQARRLTQPEVAEGVGVTPRAYQAWEAGSSDIGTRNLMRLATFFGVAAEFIEHGPSDPMLEAMPEPTALFEQREDYYERLNRLEQELRKINAALSILFSDRVLMVATEQDIAAARLRLAAGSPPPAA